EPVAAGDGVVSMFIQAVIGFDYTRSSALRRYGVTAHGIDLGDDCDAELGVDLGSCDSSAQASAPTTHKKNVVRRDVHNHPTGGRAPRGEPLSIGPSARHSPPNWPSEANEISSLETTEAGEERIGCRCAEPQIRVHWENCSRSHLRPQRYA